MATCHQSPYLCPVPSATKTAIITVTSFATKGRATRTAHAYGALSHYDVFCYCAGHAQRYGRSNVRTDTLPHLIYKDNHNESTITYSCSTSSKTCAHRYTLDTVLVHTSVPCCGQWWFWELHCVGFCTVLTLWRVEQKERCRLALTAVLSTSWYKNMYATHIQPIHINNESQKSHAKYKLYCCNCNKS